MDRRGSVAAGPWQKPHKHWPNGIQCRKVEHTGKLLAWVNRTKGSKLFSKCAEVPVVLFAEKYLVIYILIYSFTFVPSFIHSFIQQLFIEGC